MFIRAIKLKGFKSFADETEIFFSEGINCIVGPNGCGKSNVVDAIRWVVGDKSAKVLRAENQKDLIFKGTDTRRASRSAEVALILADEENLFSRFGSVVEVKRKVNSSGESEFSINNRKVKLKDIQDFFSSVGIGNRNYVFFEQGQVDKVLKLKPQERKALIDEAAEILQFKEKKENTLKELMEAEKNLSTLKKVVSEVEKSLKVLKEQAEKAKTYKDLKEKEKNLKEQLKKESTKLV